MINDEAANNFAVKAICFPSQKKNSCYKVRLDVQKVPLEVENASCECPIGQAGGCGHVCGLLYTFAGYQASGCKALPMDVAKTSQPRTWHVPRGKTIAGKEVQSLQVQGYGNKSRVNEEPPRVLTSTLYDPRRTSLPSPADMHQPMLNVHPKCMALDIMMNNHTPTVATKYGSFPKGSPISYQQSLSGEYVLNIMDSTAFPPLPTSDILMTNLFHLVPTESQLATLASLSLTKEEAMYFEENTRLQSDTKLWFQVRKFLITASNVGSIAKRTRSDPTKLVERLQSTRLVQTAAMKEGLAREPQAATKYAEVKANLINLYPCGCVVSCTTPWLAASPDRKVYDASKQPPYGLLEIKCPQDENVSEADWLKKENGQLCLKKNHNYFYQVLCQMAVTGLPWCDFFTWCYKDDPYHLETIIFDEYKQFWQEAKNKNRHLLFSHFCC